MAFPALALNPQTFAWGIVLALILGISAGAGSIWYVKGLQIDVIKATQKAEIAQMETKVAKAEGKVTELSLTFDKNLSDKKNELDETYTARIAALNSSVGKLATISLRDPSAGRNSGSTGNQGNTQGDNGSNTDGAGLLSPEAGAFLWSFAGESQLYLDRLNQCKAWNTELEAQSQKYYDEIQLLKKQVK